MIIYADIVVLENTIVNLFLLMITMKSVRHKYKRAGILSASFVGGLYTMVMFVPNLSFFRNFPIPIFVAYLMVRMSSGKMNFSPIFYIYVYAKRNMFFVFNKAKFIYIRR